MKNFDSLLKFSEHLIKVATVELRALESGLEFASELIKKEAQREIGYLQPEIGPFPAWEELAESTKRDKERLGYVFNNDYNPLLRTGDLKNSIEYEVNIAKLESIIGTKSMIGAYQEYGTNHIPPRPFMGPAAFKNGPMIAKIFGVAATMGIAGGNIVAKDIGRALGYHLDIQL